jgi:non-canonical purine NTP pyrophosphatase (RdgB/HAM1 family)
MNRELKGADAFLRKVSFVTGNAQKVLEVAAILGEVKHVDIDLPEIQELDPRKVVLAKAKAAVERGFSPVLIEDTSLSLAALNGLPGPLIKWFLKALGAEGFYRLAATTGDLSADVKTIFGLALGPQTILYGEGTLRGTLVAPRGGGFGWDSIFQPHGFTTTFGEMAGEAKQQMSMRTLALRDLREQLARFEDVLTR